MKTLSVKKLNTTKELKIIDFGYELQWWIIQDWEDVIASKTAKTIKTIEKRSLSFT